MEDTAVLLDVWFLLKEMHSPSWTGRLCIFV